MTRKSIIAREVVRDLTVHKYAGKKRELMEQLKATQRTWSQVVSGAKTMDPGKSEALFHELMQLQQKLQKLPRDAHAVRRRRRCQLTGRPRGVYRKFQVCRHQLRDLAAQGFVPGLVKGSW